MFFIGVILLAPSCAYSGVKSQISLCVYLDTYPTTHYGIRRCLSHPTSVTHAQLLSSSYFFFLYFFCFFHTHMKSLYNKIQDNIVTQNPSSPYYQCRNENTSMILVSLQLNITYKIKL